MEHPSFIGGFPNKTSIYIEVLILPRLIEVGYVFYCFNPWCFFRQKPCWPGRPRKWASGRQGKLKAKEFVDVEDKG